MSNATVLITDPLGGDASVIVGILEARGFRILVPNQDESWLALAPKAHGMIVNLATVDAAVFKHLVGCRVIARLGVGINNIDVAAARERNIVITNVPDYCREEVSDHALALILAMVRKLPLANAEVQSGRWDQLAFRPIRRLSVLTLGLIGFGRLAQTLARKACTLGMNVIAHDPHVSTEILNTVPNMPLLDLLRIADVVSLHVPLLRETRAMIGEGEFARMKRGAILINTSRGEVIDEVALIRALNERHLSGAALDVFAHEPLPANSPLRGRANVILTPHMAFYSEESLEDLQRIAAEDVARILSGEAPLHRVA